MAPTLPPVRGETKEGLKYTKDFDAKFLTAQHKLLVEARISLTGQKTPVITVVMAQFVHEMGIEWHLMSATAIMAMAPAFVLTLFGQKYVIRGLKI